MPAEVCRARARAFGKMYQAQAGARRVAHDTCPRSLLAYHLAAELLVSPEALRFRLQDLGVGDA